MLSEITVVLSPTIYASTILIAELGCGAFASEFPEPTGACSTPVGGRKHACVMHAVVKCKSSAVVDPFVPYPSYL